MNPAFEAYLARIYTDEAERARFLADPRSRAAAAGLGAREADALAAIDRDGLLLAADSFSRKRTRSARARSARFFMARAREWTARWKRVRADRTC